MILQLTNGKFSHIGYKLCQYVEIINVNKDICSAAGHIDKNFSRLWFMLYGSAPQSLTENQRVDVCNHVGKN